MDTQTVKVKVTPRDFFLWLGAMVALYLSVIWTILLVHAHINLYIPDATQYDDPAGLMRISIAFLVVSVPLCVYLLRVVHEDIRREPARRDMWVRRWLVVLTLFVAGVTIASDVVYLINVFLQGELSLRFALKALTFIVLPGAVFWYFLEELKGTWEHKKKLSETIALTVVVAVLILIGSAFGTIGSPFTQRLVQLDNQRIMDLTSLQSAIVYHYQRTGALPESIDTLRDPLSGFVEPLDPETKLPYVYEKTGTLSFKMCATFATEGDEMTIYGKASRPNIDSDWSRFEHGIGEVCFDRPIDPKLYPPFDQATTKTAPAMIQVQ